MDLHTCKVAQKKVPAFIHPSSSENRVNIGWRIEGEADKRVIIKNRYCPLLFFLIAPSDSRHRYYRKYQQKDCNEQDTALSADEQNVFLPIIKYVLVKPCKNNTGMIIDDSVLHYEYLTAGSIPGGFILLF